MTLGRLRQLVIRLNPFQPAGSDARLQNAYAEFIAAKYEWLSTLEKLAVRARPDLRVEISAKFRLQHLYDQRSRRRLEHLLAHDPGRVQLRADLSRLHASIEQAWSDADAARLSAMDGDYLCTEEEIASLRAGPQLQDDAFAALEASPEYRNAAKRLLKRMRQVNARLAAAKAVPRGS